MCGIVGKISFQNKPVPKGDITRMAQAISHRGPDGSGVFISPDTHVGLGHARLSIVDLSPAGAQPMSYMGRYTIVFNGEIYNFREKRQELQRLGYTFSSLTDTEVIMALYDKYKEECVVHMRGMFAFTIYDNQEKILFCARDRVGQKPFKYFFNENVCIFASEIKAIITQHEYKKSPDKDAITQMLVLQYVPEEKTGFLHIKKLLPGHWMKIHIPTKNITTRPYWNIDYTTNYSRTFLEWKRGIRDKLQAAVTEQMVADVPVGAMLSGGVDSSLIVALMAEQSTSPIETFSVGFSGSRKSELPYANMVSKRYKTSHHELHISPATIDILPELVRMMEEPFADHGALPTLLISQELKKYVKVALNGDGGDENFAGYDRYTIYWLSTLIKPFSLLLRPLATIQPYQNKIRRFITSLSYAEYRRYLEYLSYLPASTVSYQDNDSIKKAWEASKTTDWLNRLLDVDFHTYLPGALLPKVDMAAMAASLEVRSPFLDHELLEYTATMPARYKIHTLERKYILKDIARELLPHEIIDRKKQGFSVPLNQWFTSNFLSYAKSILLSRNSSIAQYVPKEYIQNTISTQEKSPTQGRQLWALLMLELWLQEYKL